MIGVVFFGTSQFALPILKKLYESDLIEITTVITQPDKPAGRKQEPLASPVKLRARELGLKISQPEKLNVENTEKADLFIVASYGQIIPKEVLDLPRLGTLNIHPSFLPKYRGPSPIQNAILRGDETTGVSIMLMDEEVDHGPIVAVSDKLIVDRKEYQKLHGELAETGADLLIDILPDFIEGKIKPAAQEHEKATFTKPITKQDGKIDWNDSVQKIDRKICAFHIWPVSWSTLEGKRLKIFSALPHPGSLDDRQAGDISIKQGEIFVSCGTGYLQIHELQLEGSKRMSSSQFLLGHSGLGGKKLV